MELALLGTRGIPATHGGFETFAEQLAIYLTGLEWSVTVYCQIDGKGPVKHDIWNGVHRVLIPVARAGALATVEFDFKSIIHVLRAHHRHVLTLGYNTAVFCTLLRLAGTVNLMNMDGLEWKRQKWHPWQRAWLWANERIGCHVANHLIADHPAIAKHLETRVRSNKVTIIPYGAMEYDIGDIDISRLYGLEPRRYALLVARPEPENSILELVHAYSARERGMQLVVLGHYDDANDYHREVLDAAGTEVTFLGTVYEKRMLFALRKHAALYLHGHQVGGTNPSLVESLAAGSAVMAHDNVFNRWVAGDGAVYFLTEADCDRFFTELLNDDVKLEMMRNASLRRYRQQFTWGKVLKQYETLLGSWMSPRG